MDLNKQELNEFLVESFELLDMAETNLLNYDSTGDYKTNYDSLFRAFHSLKGACGMMGLLELQDLLHRLEDLLVNTKSVSVITKDQLDIFIQGVDKAKQLFNEVTYEKMNSENVREPQVVSIDANSSAEMNEAIIEFLAECAEISSRVSKVLQKLENKNYNHDDIDSLYRDVHTLKGSAYLFEYKQLGDIGHAIESSLDPIRQENMAPEPNHIDHLFHCLDLIDQMIANIAEQKPLNFEDQVTKCAMTLTLLSESQIQKKTDNPNIQKVSLTVSSENKIVEHIDVDSIPISQTTVSMNATTSGQDVMDKESASSIRVSVSLLDKLMTLMGEMVLVRNQVIQYSSNTDDLEFLNLSQRLNVVTSEIQGEMMKTRMQPIGNVLTKFTRVVRDLAKDLGKKIEIKFSGNETELDKTLLEAVKDPLTHIVRNSCDHGIESIDERRRKGKTDFGTIHVKSYHEGGQVIVEVQDDGAGLNKDRIISKAIEKNILTLEKSQLLSDREIFHLIFAPGFSTSAKITNVSGRGVGMDVVKTNIEKIGGTVELSSDLNRGTSIKLKIPLTLAIVPALIVKSGSDHFAIPQLKLVELVRVENSSESVIEFIQGNPVYRLRGQILPLVSLNKVLGLKQEAILDATNIIILKSENYIFGLIVDEVQDTADIVVKPLSRFLKAIEVYSGATVLGDGSVALILDVHGLTKNQMLDVDHSKSNQQMLDIQNKQKLISELQDFLLVRVNSNVKHAIVLGYVNRLEEFKSQDIEQTAHKMIVRYRNSVLPLLNMNEALGLNSSSVTTEKKDIISVIVIEKSGLMYGLIVDEILDVLNTDKELDTTVTEPNGIIGNLVTDEEVITVLDPYKIINNYLHIEEVQLIQEQPDEIRAAKKARQSKIQSGEQILFVEDTIFFKRHVSKALEKAGYVVTHANDGKEALEILENNTPNKFKLILSDIEMPNMNGFQFAEAVSKNPKYQNLPKIALSTRSDESHIQKGMASGFDLYLEKMNVEQLLTAIDKLKLKETA